MVGESLIRNGICSLKVSPHKVLINNEGKNSNLTETWHHFNQVINVNITTDGTNVSPDAMHWGCIIFVVFLPKIHNKFNREEKSEKPKLKEFYIINDLYSSKKCQGHEKQRTITD